MGATVEYPDAKLNEPTGALVVTSLDSTFGVVIAVASIPVGSAKSVILIDLGFVERS